MAVERTVRERQLAVQEAVKSYLTVPSPYSAWEPIEKMNLHISKTTHILTVNEIEGRYIMGAYPKSDMYIVRAIHNYGHCTKGAAAALIRYWKKKDMEEAGEKKREELAIPQVENNDAFWSRIVALCQGGLLVRHEFWTNEIYRTLETVERPRTILSATGIAVNMYKTVLQDNLVAYNVRQTFASEDEIFRKVSNSILTAAFLNSPFLTGVRFCVSQQVGRTRVQFLSVLKMASDGKSENPCKIICESLSLYTNPKVITRENRAKGFFNRIKELSEAVEEIRKTEPATYIAFCLEDMWSIQYLKDCIKQINPMMFRYCMVTTGTVLEGYKVLNHPENLANCFLEFDTKQQYALVGVTGYYFINS